MKFGCTNPKTGYEMFGQFSKSGKKKICFSAHPPVKQKYKTIELPCNACMPCRLRKKLDWTIRNTHESQMHAVSSFVTLTYDDEQMPEHKTLVVEHHQKFIRALRAKLRKQKINIRFFLCGEYGDPEKGTRELNPHYHAIIYGYNFPDRTVYKSKNGIVLYESKLLDAAWGRGSCKVSDVSPDTMAYVSGYTTKKIIGKKAEEHYAVIDRETGEIKTETDPITGKTKIMQRVPEYANMSLKPGIGATWFAKFSGDVYPHDYVVHKAAEVPVPRYYDRLLEESNPQQMETVKQSREDYVAEHSSLIESLDSRRKVREQCAIARNTQIGNIGRGKYRNGGLTAQDLTANARHLK